MKHYFDDVAKLPTRCLNGQWQVLLSDPLRWEDAMSKDDAYNLAIACGLAECALEGRKAGPVVAKQLQVSGRAWEVHFDGKPCELERRCLHAAQAAVGIPPEKRFGC